MEPFNFDKLPEVVRVLFEKVEHLEKLLLELKPTIPEDNELLTVREAADYLRVSVQAIYTKVSRGEIPVSKPGRRLYFNKSDLKRWVGYSRKKSAIEINYEAKDRLSFMQKGRNLGNI